MRVRLVKEKKIINQPITQRSAISNHQQVINHLNAYWTTSKFKGTRADAMQCEVVVKSFNLVLDCDVMREYAFGKPSMLVTKDKMTKNTRRIAICRGFLLDFFLLPITMNSQSYKPMNQ